MKLQKFFEEVDKVFSEKKLTWGNGNAEPCKTYLIEDNGEQICVEIKTNGEIDLYQEIEKVATNGEIVTIETLRITIKNDGKLYYRHKELIDQLCELCKKYN